MKSVGTIYPLASIALDSRLWLRQPCRVNGDDFSEAALVVLGHGTTQNANSAAPVYQHAAELRRRKIFAEVREAFWKQEPQIKKILSEISAPWVFIVPLFISEGYFSDEVIPRELGFAGRSSLVTRHSSLHYCRPVGTHDSMTRALLARAREIVEQFPFPHAPKPKDITLFVAGHGTEKNENSRQAIERQVGLIRALNLYAAVHAIFLEESPRIADYPALAQTKYVVMVPFFISDGLHTQEDIPVLLGEAKRVVEQRLATGQPAWRNPTEKNGKLVWYSPAIGSEPHIADVILERVREAAKNSSSLSSSSSQSKIKRSRAGTRTRRIAI
ncbi:MAG: CbiX/SirB N-terminal domain-containing protein [Verrucomicrobiota bacterium]